MKTPFDGFVRWGAGALLIGWCFLLSAEAAELPKEWKETPLGKSLFGEVWLGERFKPESLRGKVVVLDFWGCDHKEFSKTVGALAELNAKYHKYGMVALGAHARGPQKDEAVKAAREWGANYPILSGAQVHGLALTTIPYTVVFSPDGEIAWHGNAMGKKTILENAIRENLRNVKTEADLARQDQARKILSGREFDKVPDVAKAVWAGQFGTASKTCQSLQKKPGPAADQAKAILDALEVHAREKFDEADKQKAESPLTATDILKDIQAAYAGTDHAKSAADRLKDLAKDKDFQADMKAEKEYLDVVSVLDKLPPVPETLQELEAWKKTNKAAIDQAKSRGAAFKKKYPDSRFTKKLDERLGKFE